MAPPISVGVLDGQRIFGRILWNKHLLPYQVMATGNQPRYRILLASLK